MLDKIEEMAKQIGAVGKGVEKVSKSMDNVAEAVAKVSEKPDTELESGVKSDKTEPLTMTAYREMTYDGNTILLPDGYGFLFEVNGVWVAGHVDGDGNKEFISLVSMANFIGKLDENLAQFMEDQADRMDELSMTYRIIAKAIRGKSSETSQDKE